jgi:hypothetical protein|tara:strand:+ start:731 stop:1294 length:564 start_codon:yes stop_codon:yes gene_type:complete
MKHKLTIVKDAVPLHLLDLLKDWSIQCEEWSLKYPVNHSIDERFPKINLINNDGNTIAKATGAGIAYAILSMIHQKCKLITMNVYCAGIGVRDKHTYNNMHTDHKHDMPPEANVIKVLGLLESDWKEDWGGGFHWDGKDYYAPPGSFMIFNPGIPHKAGDIYCEKKRWAIDYSVASSTPYVVQSPYS